MLTNADLPQARARLVEARRRLPAVLPLLDAFEGRPEEFSLLVEGSGLEFRAMASVGRHPNRAVIKLFEVGDGPLEGRTAVFFYKKSQIPWSRDRHSYGVCLVGSSGPAPGEVEEWVSFASTGFDPERRPSRLRQAFTFTVPD